MKLSTKKIKHLLTTKPTKTSLDLAFAKIATPKQQEAKVLEAPKPQIGILNFETTYKTDPAYASLVEIINSFEQTYNSIVTQQEALKKHVTECDNSIMDILHDIELSFDDTLATGYKLTKKIHDIRTSRRRAKDKLEFIAQLKEKCHCSIFKTFTEFEEKMRKREYKHRVANSYFDDQS